jgi:hypothetical protein
MTLDTHRTNRRSIITFSVLLFWLVSLSCLIWGGAHSQQAGSDAAERKFENTVPEHVPSKSSSRAKNPLRI